MNQFFTPTMIIENTQLGKVVSLLKGLERNFNTKTKKRFLISKFMITLFSCIKAKGSEYFEVKNRFFVFRVGVSLWPF